ncbi:hypothetical protein [Deinococcus fonticola]|uniref:hypothetical protein n=1 Tax=Deinococcus fonticola TaxID=2528713 RepID=UPI001F0FEC3F|nr:hypothetical protein [Deinococcus fonticola]
MIEVRILTAQDVESYRVVRHTVLNSDPVAFVTTAAEFAARDTEGIAAQISPTEQNVTFGAFLGGQLVGILSLARETRRSLGGTDQPAPGGGGNPAQRPEAL